MRCQFISRDLILDTIVSAIAGQFGCRHNAKVSNTIGK